MKVLILSTGTGEGHNSAAKAVKEQFEKRGIPCELADVLNFASDKAGAYGRRIYIWSTVRAKKVFAGAYRVGRAISSARLKSPVCFANALYADKLCSYITENGYDTVVMPHLFPAEAMTWLLRQHKLDVQTYFIATDYTCIPFTEETDCDYYVIPGEKQIAEFRKRRIPAEKLLPFGIPVAMACDTDLTKQQARQALGLSEDLVYILLTGGSIGAGNIEETIRSLLRYLKKSGKQGKIIAVCGSNDKLYDRLQAAYGEKLVLLHRTRQMALYMRACDLFLSKPGGLSSTEAAVLHVPYIQIAPIPGCETKNMQFFAKNGMSIAVKHPSLQLKRAVNKLLREEDARRQKSSQFLIPQDARAALCDWLEEKLQQQTDKQE